MLVLAKINALLECWQTFPKTIRYPSFGQALLFNRMFLFVGFVFRVGKMLLQITNHVNFFCRVYQMIISEMERDTMEVSSMILMDWAKT